MLIDVFCVVFLAQFFYARSLVWIVSAASPAAVAAATAAAVDHQTFEKYHFDSQTQKTQK